MPNTSCGWVQTDTAEDEKLEGVNEEEDLLKDDVLLRIFEHRANLLL